MDFLYKKHPKGTYEHIGYRRKVDILVTVFLFALALGLYVIGRVTTGSNRNLLTIVAVLGLLPACKMVVDVIMCFRVKQCASTDRVDIDAAVGDLYGQYNMMFTSYDKNYMIDHLVVTSNSVIGYSSSPKYDDKAFQAHLQDLMRKEGIKDALIKIFTNKDKYINRLNELNELVKDKNEVDESGDHKCMASPLIASLIHNVTF